MAPGCSSAGAQPYSNREDERAVPVTAPRLLPASGNAGLQLSPCGTGNTSVASRGLRSLEKSQWAPCRLSGRKQVQWVPDSPGRTVHPSRVPLTCPPTQKLPPATAVLGVSGKGPCRGSPPGRRESPALSAWPPQDITSSLTGQLGPRPADLTGNMPLARPAPADGDLDPSVSHGLGFPGAMPGGLQGPGAHPPGRGGAASLAEAEGGRWRAGKAEG